MSGLHSRARAWLGSVVAAHLVVFVLHGAAHAGARVPLSPAANLFVFGVIFAGPLAGLALMWRAERLGLWMIAGTMAASLVFGLVNHFLLASPDQVGHIDQPWRSLFATTAALLAATEAAGTMMAICFDRRRVT